MQALTQSTQLLQKPPFENSAGFYRVLVKIHLRKKITAFLVLLGSTCAQNFRQFEFLTLAIKISFLFDFCTDVLLINRTYDNDMLNNIM